jgi:hypothetical protein
MDRENRKNLQTGEKSYSILINAYDYASNVQLHYR